MSAPKATPLPSELLTRMTGDHETDHQLEDVALWSFVRFVHGRSTDQILMEEAEAFRAWYADNSGTTRRYA